MLKIIRQQDVPEGMLGELPWGEPLQRWDRAMLSRALEDGHVDDAPHLAAAIRKELTTR